MTLYLAVLVACGICFVPSNNFIITPTLWGSNTSGVTPAPTCTTTITRPKGRAEAERALEGGARVFAFGYRTVLSDSHTGETGFSVTELTRVEDKNYRVVETPMEGR